MGFTFLLHFPFNQPVAAWAYTVSPFSFTLPIKKGQEKICPQVGD